jgi:nitroreductase
MSVDPALIQRFLRSLRADRHYLPDPVAAELVDGWLEVARWCGSSRNSQPWRFVVVRDRAVLAALADLGEDTSHLRDAAVVIAVAAVEGPFAFSTIFDLGRVTQSLMLAAAADGVGSCVAVFEPASSIDAARDLIGVPESCRLDLAVGFGHPDRAGAAQRPDRPRRGRKHLDEIVGYERGSSAWEAPTP